MTKSIIDGWEENKIKYINYEKAKRTKKEW